MFYFWILPGLSVGNCFRCGQEQGPCGQSNLRHSFRFDGVGSHVSVLTSLAPNTSLPHLGTLMSRDFHAVLVGSKSIFTTSFFFKTSKHASRQTFCRRGHQVGSGSFKLRRYGKIRKAARAGCFAWSSHRRVQFTRVSVGPVVPQAGLPNLGLG